MNPNFTQSQNNVKLWNLYLFLYQYFISNEFKLLSIFMSKDGKDVAVEDGKDVSVQSEGVIVQPFYEL